MNSTNKEFISKFNKKDRHARAAVFTSNGSMSIFPVLSVLLAYLRETAALPVEMFVQSQEDLLRRVRTVWNIPFAKLSEKEDDIPGAIASLAANVIVGFLKFIPGVLALFGKYVKTNQRELGKLELLEQKQFVEHAWECYIRKLRSVKGFVVSGEEFISSLENSLIAYIRNLPIMESLLEMDGTIWNLLDPDSDISIVASLHYIFEQSCRAYGQKMSHYCSDMYYNFEDRKANCISYDDAYSSFQAFSINVISARTRKNAEDKKRTLSLRVESIRTYLSSIIRSEIYDTLFRNSSTMTAAASKNVGFQTDQLEDKEANEDAFAKACSTPENKIALFKKALYKASGLSKTQEEILEFIYTHGEERPKYIAKALGMEDFTSNITTEKFRARQKIRQFRASAAGKKLFDYYGIVI